MQFLSEFWFSAPVCVNSICHKSSAINRIERGIKYKPEDSEVIKVHSAKAAQGTKKKDRNVEEESCRPALAL